MTIVNKTVKKHTVGEVHPNGKWVWTEYKEGKFDWRGIKTTTAAPAAKTAKTEKAISQKKEDKPRTKKQFINETSYNLTKEECKEYWKLGKLLDVYARSSWNYAMGRIGSCTLSIENQKTGKTKNWDNRPNWRPLGHYRFSMRGWNGERVEVEGWIQSWDEIRNISDTESFTVDLMKHPHQFKYGL